ncbi:DUF4139 domain-containing protein [Terracidiphilus gabretensis]|uniref:DUF4139 domain-containing protein n=1 Tax=Terracidiphilus gabretensis TaxID=1577687 RepID=UPI00071B1B6A|nr:DUF4139 domain-containing protein [Terracidiphilus gabretensis]
MNRGFALVCLASLLTNLYAEPAPKPAPKTAPAASDSSSSASANVIRDLPVRRVVLYKNGVGYFEHAGSVTGNQRVGIDFTSSQLNDVLQSLTVLDEGGGRIAGVNYNSTTPIAEQLRTLALGLMEFPPTLAIYQALRGQHVEVSGSGAPISGRIVNIEFRTMTDKNGASTNDHYFLIVATDAGALRTADLTDAVSVRMTDTGLQKQFASYLETIASGQNRQVRHLTLSALGQGQRQLRVSYISEVPIWKSTYRIVFPHAEGDATIQGWAVVDNTVGSDWENVQLSLVAGAPQSFIQPLSQPLYTHRPEIPIAVNAQTVPQTHDAAEIINAPLAGRDVSQLAKMAPGAASQTVMVNAGSMDALEARGTGSGGGIGSGNGNGYGAGVGGNFGGGIEHIGGVFRASDAFDSGSVSTNAFDDFFAYALTQPVTIRKNESAMVPILQEQLPAEHVTLWSERERAPLRAVWLNNTSKLTLDSGSFSIFEGGEFAGEGLLDPIHPGEKRLLSYAVDQAVKIRRVNGTNTSTLHHIAMRKGVIVESSTLLMDSNYTVANGADEPRTVIIEHQRYPNADLKSDLAPAETTASGYRFRVVVQPHQTATLHVGESAKLNESVYISQQNNFRSDYLVNASKYSPDLEQKLRPLIDAETAVSDLNAKIVALQQKEKTLADDEARARENVTALKGNEAAKRFVDELTRAEDALQQARQQRELLEKDREAAQAHLDELIAQISFDSDLSVTTQSTTR